jgi:hypothetical protein
VWAASRAGGVREYNPRLFHSGKSAHWITQNGNGVQLKRSAAQIYALTFGALLTIAGIVGFFYSASFPTGSAVKNPAKHDAVLGIFETNGWTNVFLIVTGVILLGWAGSWYGSRVVSFVIGIVYLALATADWIAGDGGSVIGLFPVDTTGSVLDTIIGTLGVLAALVTPSVPAPSLMTPAELRREHVPQLDSLP